MKSIITSLFAFVLISTSLFGKNVVVNCKDDMRLKAYKDSMTSYEYGLWQIKVATYLIRDELQFNPEAENTAMGMIEQWAKRRNVNKNIKPINKRNDLKFLYAIKQRTPNKSGEWNIGVYWSPEVYKKPVVTVIYEEPKIKIESATTVSIDVIKQSPVIDTGIWMPSGDKMSKKDFIARYGNETYNRIFGIY